MRWCQGGAGIAAVETLLQLPALLGVQGGTNAEDFKAPLCHRAFLPVLFPPSP